MTTATSASGRTMAGAGDVRSSWLVRLRWGSVAGQTLIVLAAWRLAHLPLPVAVLLGLVAAIAASNAVLAAWLDRGGGPLSVRSSGCILALDMALLTAMLYVTGGASNPFSVFYLVYITAAAVTLGSSWTWGLAALGVGSYAALFAMPTSLDPAGPHAAHLFARHLEAMWVALTLAAALTAFFVTRLTSSLASRERELDAMRESAARRDRLAALTTLAAGAAHELATPLTTVAVAAGELERAVSQLPPEPRSRMHEDVRLIRAEVSRCREILDEIGAGSGRPAAEMPTPFNAGDLLSDVAGRLHPDAVARLATTMAGGTEVLVLPRRALTRVVLSLVQNAVDASPAGATVALDIEAGEGLRISVRDDGPGMSPDVLTRAGEPFFTTKQPGHGLGLGLFLARSLAEELGGRLVLDSLPGRGTTARLDLPARIEAHVQPA